MQRGEVWWAQLAGDAGFRPVAIVSRTSDIMRRTSITVAEITSTVRGRPSEVLLSPRDGMPVGCAINTDNLHTIPTRRLVERITQMVDEQLFALDNALRFSLELDA